MKLISIQVGKVRSVDWRGKKISTGIWKEPVQGSVNIGAMSLAGDEQAELKVHGGRDKAVYAYGMDSLDYWRQAMPERQFIPGIFGENLTFDHLDERTICAGDIFQIGKALLQ